MIWRRTLQGLGIAVLLLALGVGAVIWKIRSGDECLAFGDAYTPIGELQVDGRPYYVYGVVSGFQDKVQLVQISAVKLPQTVCRTDEMARPIESVVVEEPRVIKKVLVSRKPGSGLTLDFEYGAALQAGARQQWELITIEVR